ncbi:MAG: hypothetical protein AAGI17_01920 [Planctomycetota bacterium]
MLPELANLLDVALDGRAHEWSRVEPLSPEPTSQLVCATDRARDPTARADHDAAAARLGLEADCTPQQAVPGARRLAGRRRLSGAVAANGSARGRPDDPTDTEHHTLYRPLLLAFDAIGAELDLWHVEADH